MRIVNCCARVLLNLSSSPAPHNRRALARLYSAGQVMAPRLHWLAIGLIGLSDGRIFQFHEPVERSCLDASSARSTCIPALRIFDELRSVAVLIVDQNIHPMYSIVGNADRDRTLTSAILVEVDLHTILQ